VLLAGAAAAISLRVARAHSRAVQAYREVAERRADELEQFAARMAHDVRTPLSAAGLSVGLAEKFGGDDPRFHRAIQRVRTGVTQTTRIIEALFEFARSGARPQTGARACVAEAAEDVATVMQSRAEEVGAEIVVRANSRALVPCSGGVLGIAIGNLVGNALTYVEGAAARRVTIEIADDGREVKTTVLDTGPGLPPGTAGASLFEPYVRGEQARGRGLGLGLATVKRIVSAHGGHVGVHSSPGGCVFWFTLPVAGAEPVPAQTPTQAPATQVTGASPTRPDRNGSGRVRRLLS
jgi:signal transduction histidine kinase